MGSGVFVEHVKARATGTEGIGGMKDIISGRDLPTIRPFSGSNTTIWALKIPVSGALIMNNQELPVARPRENRPKKLEDKTGSGQQYQVGHPFLHEIIG